MSDQFSPRLATGWPGVSPDLCGSWTEGLLSPAICFRGRSSLSPSGASHARSGTSTTWRLHGHVAFFPDERVLRWLPHAAHTEQHPCLLLFSQRFPVFSQALGDNSASRDPDRHRGDAYAVLALEIAGESHAISNQLILAGELKRLIDLNHRDGITSGIKDEEVRGRIVPIRSFALPASVERRVLRVDRAGRRPDTTCRE